MSARAFPRVVAVVTAVVVAFTAGSVPATAAIARSEGTATDTPPCAGRTEAIRIGVSPGASIATLSTADLDRELTLARDAGSFAVRLDIDWSAIESTRGTFDWSRTDRVIDAVVAHGMCVHGIIAYTPRWARVVAAFNDSHSRPANAATFAAFATTVVQRYSSRINIWEVWNEPNIVTFFKPAPDVTAYSALLRATYTAIKKVQPASTVLAGGMAPSEDKDGNIAGTTFLTKMYAQGSNRYFDAFNVHPYTWPYLPNDPSTASWNTAMKMWSMRDTMISGGDSGKQIWITEFGAPTGTAPNSVSEQVQSESIGIVLDAVLGTDWLGPAYVYSLRDAGSNTADTEQNFGVVRRDWTPKIAYGRVDAYAAEHSGR